MVKWIVWRKDTAGRVEYLQGSDRWAADRASAKGYTCRGGQRLQTISAKRHLGWYRDFGTGSPMFYVVGCFYEGSDEAEE